MRRLAPLALAIGAMLVGPADVAAAQAPRAGVIKGQVINETLGHPQEGVRVVLLGASKDGSGEERKEVTTDRNGRYRFADLPSGENQIYALDAYWDGGLFAGGAVTIPGLTDRVPVIDSKLRVWDTTTEPTTILIRRGLLFATLDDDGELRIVETIRVINQTDRAYIGRGAGLAGAKEGETPSLGFSLPSGAKDQRIIDSDIDIPILVDTDFGVAATVAIPPGDTQVTFGYGLEGQGGSFDLTRTALYPILDVAVHATPPLEVLSNRLDRDGEVTIGDETYARWSGEETVEAGDPIQLVAVARADVTPSWLAAALPAGLAIIVLAVFAFTRRRKLTSHPSAARADPTRAEIIDELARLDLRRDAGEVSTEEWSHRRAELKRLLAEPPAGSRARS
ncbi:MAG: carboxypeptidase-like regulatory domain-containing protein [Actinomycetota bacterium]|nr:carboxypeptidase-like regulatory domain-containing protein [Actinomycetota bacterium]